MARNTFEAWIPEEYDSKVLQRVNQVSGVETYASRIPMKSDTKSVPRSAGVDVEYITKGSAYGEDASTNDDVVLTARKFGKAIRIADEDLDDSLANIVETKQVDWATSYGKTLDNATLAVTAAVGTGVPFVSVYKALTDYNSGSNITTTGTGGVTYSKLSTALSLVEGGDYFDEPNMVILAHPAFRESLRGVVDDNHRPIFLQGLAGTPDSLFGVPVHFSAGIKTSATMTPSPGGNPLMVVANRNYLLLGIRSGPESMFAGADTGPAFLTDEALLKLRARRGFALGIPQAAAILEKTA